MSQRIRTFIRIRPADCYLSDTRSIQWQHILIIFQEYDRFTGGLQSDFLVFFLFYFFIRSFQISLIRIIEQADKELHSQNITYTVIDDFFAQSAFFHQLPQRQYIRIRRAERTTHIQSGFHTLANSFFHIFGSPVFGIKIFYGITVRNYIPTESHFTAQAGSQPVIAALNRKAVIVIIRTHHTKQSRFTDNSFERIGMEHLHFAR